MEIEYDAQGDITQKVATDPSLSDEELYKEIKKLESEIDYLEIQELFIKEEQLNLRKEILRAKEEIKKIQCTPLAIGTFVEMIDGVHALTGGTSGANHYVRV